MSEQQTMTPAPAAPVAASGARALSDEVEIRLKDLQVVHWWFFLRYPPRFDPETGRTSNTHWPVWLAALKKAVAWEKDLTGVRPDISRWREEEPPEIDYPPVFVKPERHEVKRRKENDGVNELSLQARSLLDSTYIMITWTLHEEPPVPGSFSLIRARDWDYLAAHAGKADPHYLGNSVCLTAVMEGFVKTTKHSGIEEAAEGLAKEMLKSWCGGKDVGDVKLIEFACGYYATSHELDETVWVLLVWDDKQADRQATHVVVDLTPSFMLAWLKGRFVKRRYVKAILPRANVSESKLEQVLQLTAPATTELARANGTESGLELAVPAVDMSMQKLKATEESSISITGPLDELSRRIKEIRDDLETLEINRDNLRVIMKDPVFKPGQSQMTTLMVSPLSNSVLQLRAGLGYKEATRDYAQRKLDLIKIRAEILAQKDTRGITILLGLLGIFGLVAAFDQEIEFYFGRDKALFVKLGLTVAVLVLLLGRLQREDD